MLSVIGAGVGLVALLFSAWVAGGRAVTPSSAEDLVADQTSSDGRIPLEEIDRLAELGWNVAQLDHTGLGYSPEFARTDVADGVRTVTVWFTEGENRLVVAESRPEQDSAELPSAGDRLQTGGLLDDQTVPQGGDSTDPMVLIGGESAELHHVPGESTWSAVAGHEDVQYLITSDADPAEARRIASWVMLSDRARVTGRPDAPSGVERIEEGLDRLFGRVR